MGAREPTLIHSLFFPADFGLTPSQTHAALLGCLFPELSSRETFFGDGAVAGVSRPAALSPPPPFPPCRVPGNAVRARARDSPIRPKLSDKVLRNFFILLIFSADCESIMSHIGGRHPPPASRRPRSPGSGANTAPPAPGLSPRPEEPPGQSRSGPGKEPYAAAAAAGAAGLGGGGSARLIAPLRPCPGLPRLGRTRRAGRGPRQRPAGMEQRKQSPAGGCGRRRREGGREEGREGALRERRRRSLGGPGSPGEEGRRRRGREGGRRGAPGPG